MYKFKFETLNLLSNSKRISKNNSIFFLYGLGSSSSDFEFLLKLKRINNQIIIIELPGHNSSFFDQKNCLMMFIRRIFLFIKKNEINNITFFTHSLGGIIPILLVKYFLKKKIKIRKFINYEGNLTESDTETVTKRTASYRKTEFKKKFKNLIDVCQKSNQSHLNLWSKSLKHASSDAFYELSRDAVKYSKTNELLEFFKIFFKKKIYISGSLTKFEFSEIIFGSVRFKIKNSGHFSYFENPYEFSKIFFSLILKRL